MNQRGLFETKNKFSELCDQVARSREPLVVTRHGVPLVRIVPLEPADAPSGIWDAVAEREAQYGRLTDEFELPDRDASPIRPDPLE